MNRILCHIARLPQHKVVQLKSGSKSTLHVIRPFPVVDGSRDLPLFICSFYSCKHWRLCGYFPETDIVKKEPRPSIFFASVPAFRFRFFSRKLSRVVLSGWNYIMYVKVTVIESER